MHTEETLRFLDDATDALSQQFSIFLSVTCATYETRETAKEKRTRLRRLANNKRTQPSIQADVDRQQPEDVVPSTTAVNPSVPMMNGSEDVAQVNEAENGPPLGVLPGAASAVPSAVKGFAQRKTFNLATYKYHALANYANTIRRYGTTDSYTTERVRSASLVTFQMLITF
jgi:hypothetical protein